MKILAWPAFLNRDVNPYNALLYEGVVASGCVVAEYSGMRMLKGGYDIVHYHWPDHYVNVPSLPKTVRRIAILLCSVLLCRIRKTPIVWTVHNMAPHDPRHPRLSAWALAVFARNCAGLIFLTRQSRDLFFERYAFHGRKPAARVIPHGHYKTVYPPPVSMMQARTALRLDAAGGPVLLFFGMIKPYKNVAGLLRAFAAWENPAARLVIAGKPSAEEDRRMIEEAMQCDERIRAFLHFIPDTDIALYLGAADLLVLPYTNILNSGALFLGLGYNVPVLAPAMGSMIELQADVGADWVHLFDGDISTAALAGAAVRVSLRAGEGRDNCDLSRYDWPRLAAETTEFYKEVLNRAS